jgi:hypothetical protein
MGQCTRAGKRAIMSPWLGANLQQYNSGIWLAGYQLVVFLLADIQNP